MSAVANTHINGWDSEPAKKGVQFANSVKVRTFESVTTNYGANTGETEIVANQNMTYENVNAAFTPSRTKMQSDQQKSRQKRIQSRDAKRADYKKQIATNIRIVRRKLEEFRASPLDAHTLAQFQSAVHQDLQRMIDFLHQEDKLHLGIFDEEIRSLHQVFTEIQQLQPAPATNIAAILAAESESAGKIQQGIHEVEQLLQDMGRIMTQEPTGQTLAELDTMITQADQTIRELLKTPKTPEERGTITSLIGQLREMKGQHNQYILASVGKKGGFRIAGHKTRKQHRPARHSKRSKRSKRSNRMKRV